VPIISSIDWVLPYLNCHFEKLITAKTKQYLFVIQTTGYLYSKEMMQLAASRNMICFDSDEVYREFTMVHYSVMNIPGLEENAIMIDSVSKDT
jgi:aspartate aminotransferase